ncbi:hypothetical protein [Paenarthrobacter sp. FR1]|uniref:hypothetical protein n=1 Tax=Paenarthrobacter sp. FR1 TaxID=3439548 RepID=UPI003DA21F89
MTDVGDVACTGLAFDKFGGAVGGLAKPENGRFYAVQVEMKVYDNKWMDKGIEMLNANSFSYVSPSGKELPPEKIATTPAYNCLSKGFLSMYIYEQQTGSGKIVFDIPNETGGKLVHQRYDKENLPEEEFPLDRSPRSPSASPSVATATPKPGASSAPSKQSPTPSTRPSSTPSSISAPAPSANLTSSPPNGAVAEGLRTSIAGTWTGTVTGDSSKYSVVATLRETDGFLAAEVDYPELNCKTSWREIRASGSSVSLKEKLVSGPCADNVGIALTLDNGTISAVFAGSTARDIRAVLTRK